MVGTVALSQASRSTIFMAPNATEVLFALGLGDAQVGVSGASHVGGDISGRSMSSDMCGASTVERTG